MIIQPIKDAVLHTAAASPSRKKVGAILLYKNKIVQQAYNMDTKTHPLQARLADMVGLSEKIYLHAEIAALVKNKHKCDTIVVARLGGHKHNELRNAKPCKICQLAIKEAGIRNIYYTTETGFHLFKLNT